MKLSRSTKRYLCLCLAPAVDATVRLDAWPTDGCILKDATETVVPGGKGINIARWIATRGGTAIGGGLLGEGNAGLFERVFAEHGIEDRFLRVPGATRVNETFVTPHGSFKVNRPFVGGRERTWNELVVGVGAVDVVILSGSLPADWPADTYRRLVVDAKRTGAKVVLDASGAALVEGAKAHPDVLKPNAAECEALIGFVPKTAADFRRATTALAAFCDFPIVSDGAAGCWFGGTFIAAPAVEVFDTTAAGDTLLAEWCLSGDPRRAVAAGSAACTMPGGQPPPLALVDELLGRMSPALMDENGDALDK